MVQNYINTLWINSVRGSVLLGGAISLRNPSLLSHSTIGDIFSIILGCSDAVDLPSAADYFQNSIRGYDRAQKEFQRLKIIQEESFVLCKMATVFVFSLLKGIPPSARPITPHTSNEVSATFPVSPRPACFQYLPGGYDGNSFIPGSIPVGPTGP